MRGSVRGSGTGSGTGNETGSGTGNETESGTGNEAEIATGSMNVRETVTKRETVRGNVNGGAFFLYLHLCFQLHLLILT